MPRDITPQAGRIVIRKLADANSALTGILHLPASFVPTEGAAYLATMFDGELRVYDDPMDSGINEDLEGYGIQAVLMSRTWRATSTPNSTVVRFIGAFPETNSWTFFGATVQPLADPELYDKSGHAWFDVEEGRMRPLALDVQAQGRQVAQLLTNLPIWPDRNGVLHTLPAIETSYRQAYYEHSMLMARYGAGEIDRDALNALVRADPKIFKIRTSYIDEDFCAYLAHLRDAGGILVDAPVAAHEIQARNERSRMAIRAATDPDVSTSPSSPLRPR